MNSQSPLKSLDVTGTPFLAPTGADSIARGEALGKQAKSRRQPQRGETPMIQRMFCPFRANVSNRVPNPGRCPTLSNDAPLGLKTGMTNPSQIILERSPTMTRQFTASRMSVLLSTVIAWLSIGFDDRSLCAEEPKADSATSAPADREASIAKPTDLPGSDGEPSMPGFIPQPGRFELKVTQGWTDVIPYGVDKKMMWILTGGSHVGVKRDDRINLSELGMLFFSENPVLEFITYSDDMVYLHARRPGTATIRFMCQSGSKIERCELRVIVEADTTDIDKAIKAALPQSMVKVIEIKDAAILNGTVTAEADVALVTEVAEQFYPKVINRLKVASNDKAAATTWPMLSEDVQYFEPGLLPSLKATQAASTAKAPTVVPAQSKGVQLAAAESDKKPQRQRSLAELHALRDDVRGLREDVRRLSELVEKRLALKAVELPAVDATAVMPDKAAVTDIQEGMLFFTASWCGPCQQMQPMIWKLKGEGLPIRNVDVDQDAGLFKRFNVTSIPCFVRLEKGKELDRCFLKMFRTLNRDRCRR